MVSSCAVLDAVDFSDPDEALDERDDDMFRCEGGEQNIYLSRSMKRDEFCAAGNNRVSFRPHQR